LKPRRTCADRGRIIALLTEIATNPRKRGSARRTAMHMLATLR
jgi:hypothetical protein